MGTSNKNRQGEKMLDQFLLLVYQVPPDSWTENSPHLVMLSGLQCKVI
ncbi:hypothetical protein yruck0001_10130 [Yersinia ruckeri ATCC 29473]|nr:hypothetical protein yruck0001_10130 [Yersinia ruckeri ATCC 29473]